MLNENDVTLDSSPEEVLEEVLETESQEEVTDPAPENNSDKMVPSSRLKQEADKRRALEQELAKLKNQAPKMVNQALDVEDFIDISASLEGLDSREKQYLAEQHKYTGRSLKELRNDENFLLWQDAYRAKVEKEKALSPSNTQPEADKPKSLSSQLSSARTIAEKEELLMKAGLYKTPRVNPGRVRIG